MYKRLLRIASIFQIGNRHGKSRDNECVANVNFGGIKGRLKMAVYYVIHPRDFLTDKIGIIGMERIDKDVNK